MANENMMYTNRRLGDKSDDYAAKARVMTKPEIKHTPVYDWDSVSDEEIDALINEYDHIAAARDYN